MKTYPKKDFPSMQQNPDMGFNFDTSHFKYKGNIGVDNKYTN